MKSIDQFGAKYWKRPYLSPLTSEQLGIRYGSVVANGASVGENNKINVTLDRPWLGYHVDIQAECARRRVELTEIWRAARKFEKHIPSPPSPETFNFWKSHYANFHGKGYLFRLLETSHADELLEDDRVYFRNAENYREMHLTAAQRDDERCVRIWDRSTCSWKKVVTPTAFYISSYSRVLELRFLTAFEKDNRLTCIVLKRPDEFFRRLRCAVREEYPHLALKSSRISYVDPLRVGKIRPKDVYFTKDFLHTYQQEFRFALISDISKEKESVKLKCRVKDLFERLDFPANLPIEV